MMAANLRRPRPGDGRHPPPLAPTVSSFKPRAQWTNSGSSIFLYVNLPGFYGDQIKIKKDLKTRTVQIQGQRPLSTQTKARFFESYSVPDSCDMTKSNISFSHGLLTIEFPTVVEGEKHEKAVQDQGKTVRKSSQEKSGGVGTNDRTLGRNKQASPMLNDKEPKTYKSVVEGKRVVPTGSPKKVESKVIAGEAIPSLGSMERAKEEKLIERKEAAQAIPSLGNKERAKEEKLVERKKAAQVGQQKIVQRLTEEEGNSTPTSNGSLNARVHAKEKKVIEKKKNGERNQDKNGQKPTIDASLERKVDAKVVERKGDGEISQDPKEEAKTNLGQKKQEIYTKPVVGDEGRRREKQIVATKQAEREIKTKEGDKRTELNVDEGLKSKNNEKNEKIVGDELSEGESRERVKEKKVEEAGLDKETGDLKDNTETGPLLVEEIQKKADMDLPHTVGGRGMDTEESRTYNISLVNVGAAALVIMGFGAYVFVPLVKLFS